MNNPFESLQQTERDYLPNTSIVNEMKQKTLVMFVGPSSTGKSTLMNNIIGNDPEFSRVSVFTSRQKRSNDEPGLFRYLDSDEKVLGMLSKIERKEIVQYAVYSATNMIYGSELIDYPTKYNLLATVYTVAASLAQMPFAHTVTIALLVEPSDWEKWFRMRFPTKTDEAVKRLEEARQSLRWILAQDAKSIYFYKNHPGTTSADIHALQTLIKHGKSHTLHKDEALINAMIIKADQLLKEYSS